MTQRCLIFRGWEEAKKKGARFGPMASAVQTLDSSIHRINYYPADKYYRKQLCYPLDRNLSDG